MAVGDYIADELQSALQILELANFEAVRAKQQLGRIIGEDFQVGAEVLLVPRVFCVEGNKYRAILTDEQWKRISCACGGSTQTVLNLVTGKFLNNGLYAAAMQALQTLVASLNCESVTRTAAYNGARAAVVPLGGKVNPLGACMFDSGCVENYAATLCESQGGTPQASCTQRQPLDEPPSPADGGAD
jgi:hypothetical protein